MNLKIENFTVGEGRTFVVAEIGNNHNGCVKRAKELVRLAREMNADCVKFQMRHLNQVYRVADDGALGDDLGTEYILDLLGKFELSLEEHREVRAFCHELGILYLCTPWDLSSVEVLESFSVSAYKVASADLTNIPLLDRLIETGKPLIVSTGMSTQEEVEFTVKHLQNAQSDFVLLHCNSTYPAPVQDINLNWMNSLQKLHPFIGYSGHERGTGISIAAVAMGAQVIERHFTLDRNMEGPDHAASLEFKEFKSLIQDIRDVEQAKGQQGVRQMSQGEMINRENLGKSLVAAKQLTKGMLVTPDDVEVRSPGQGISPQLYNSLLGKALQRDVKKGDFFFHSDINQQKVTLQTCNFKRPWGIPVRYHDFNQYHEMISPDLFEFHLSYSDMSLEPENYLRHKKYNCDFVVHAPELFAGSHLMDLTSQDEAYRQLSIKETQRVIDITRHLKSIFPNTETPLIVANVGGFSLDAAMDTSEREKYYLTFAKSLQELDLEGVELIPQTMAPFPWHFGGQRYQNLFVDADEIATWCQRLGLRMCFDISHSKLACNHFNWDFEQFVSKVAPCTAHLHLGDAKGVNGEGIQIGTGDIDFEPLGQQLTELCPTASFIPEIWQGHKNAGEGFWIALNKLSGLL